MPNKIDMVGKKFGRLTVLEEEIPRKGTKIKWICQCDCGNIKSVAGSDLRCGKTLSCGCLRNERVREAIGNQLEGQRFGRLTVIKQVDSIREESGQLRTAWECKCDCGNTVIVKTINLKSGDTKSCGCLNLDNLKAKRKDLTGIRFGKLIPIEIDEERMLKRKEYDTRAYWKCKCDCGNYTTVSSGELISGGTISCGCEHSQGEAKILRILIDNQINFEREKSFEDLTGDFAPLRFDFAIYNNNEIKYLIEFQGEQHFYPVEFFGGVERFEKQQRYDLLKEEYCKTNKIPLVKITYLDKEINYDLIKERYNEAQEVYGYSESSS